MTTMIAGSAGTPNPGDRTVAPRRHVIARLASVATLGSMIALVGCGEGEESPLANTDPAPTGTPTASPTIAAVTDTDLIAMMLQLHYLQAEFYARAVFGVALADALTTGTGVRGAVTGPRLVTFTDPILADMMREMAAEKIDQVVRLRSVLGSATPARPALNLGVDASGTFTRYGIDSRPAATTAVPNPAPTITDVYASQEQFLLGAFLLEDAVMMAWRGVSPLMTDAASINLAAGLLAVSAAHAGLVRLQLFVRGAASGSTLRQASIALSDLRDSYSPVDDDRGVSAAASGSGLNTADVNPSDGEGEVYGRLPNLSINVFYMTRTQATSGGFFPAGLNGTLRESTAN